MHRWMKQSSGGKARSFTDKARASISSKFSQSLRGGTGVGGGTPHSPTPDLASTNTKSNVGSMIGMKRPLVANLANVPTVKIASYSKRNPDTLFYP